MTRMSPCGSNLARISGAGSARRRHSPAERGFTLLEVIIVGVIVVILVTAVSASLSGFLTRSRLRTAIGRLTSMAVYARTQALTTGERIVLQADSNSNYVGLLRYDLESEDAELLPLDSRWQIHLPESVVIERLELQGEVVDEADIVFFPDGSATSARMELLLLAPEGYAAEQKVLTINGLTGRVEIE